MSENEKKQEDQTDEKVESKPETVSQKSSADKVGGKKILLYIGAVVVVALIILGALYLLEKEGRSPTNLFGSILSAQSGREVVATVNGEKIINSELQNIIKQFEVSASMGGADTTDPDTQAEMRSQALEMLINTTLLKQAASEKGIEVTDEQVDERLKQITEEIGGQEVLNERMSEIGINEDRLRSDIRDEILIDKLFDDVFAQKQTSVSEEEIKEFYDQTGGEEAGLPPLEEVADQIEMEINSAREQGYVQEYLLELKEQATIEQM
jgi:hypothetical protein